MRSNSKFTIHLPMLLFSCAPILAQEALSKYRVMAANLFNFLKFVEYPGESFADALAPIVFGVVGDDQFVSALPQVVNAKTVQGGALAILEHHADEDSRGAHILFIDEYESKKTARLFGQLAWIKRPHFVRCRDIPRCGRDDSVSE
jgi:hypothetical protein